MKKRYYAALSIIAIATLLLLAGAPSWLAIGSLSAISIALFILTREEEAPLELLIEIDHTDLAILDAIGKGANSVNAVARATGLSWDTASRRLAKLERLQMILGKKEDLRLSSEATLLVEKLNSRFFEKSSRSIETH